MRCDAQVTETAWHRYWECKGNHQLQHPFAHKSNWLKDKFLPGADGKWGDLQCLWGRALLPHSLAAGLATIIDQDEVLTYTAGDFQKTLAEGGLLYTDGTGGPQWANEALRRTGSGAVALHTTGSVEQGTFQVKAISTMAAQTPGAQTVPRSELWAAVAAARHTREPQQLEEGSVKRWGCDADYAVKGIH